MGGLLLASYLSGDEASMRVASKFVKYSISLWICFFLLQQDISLVPAAQWGMIAGTNVLNITAVHEVWKAQRLQRVYGSFGSPNHLAMVMEIILPFLLLNTFLTVKKVNRESPRHQKLLAVLSVITSILAIGSIVLSQSRGGIAGFLLGAIVALSAVFLSRYGLTITKKISALFLVFILSGAVVFGFTTNYLKRSYDSERILLLTSAYRMWQDHKLYGVGISRWNDIYRKKYILPGAKEPTLTLPHNNIANFFSGSGILGGGGFVIFMLSSLVYLILTIQKRKENRYSYAMLWVWIAISVHGMVDNSMFGRYNDRLFFAMWGLTLAAIQQEKLRLAAKNHLNQL
ncbi:MAG: O-antigen ligase family protein [Acidaminococcus sp.]|nr:O-antigen ligase family protein [Acidaminococcus sp.]MCI2100035.1 O-antigen ligase family protein [Acidaminococcus sp.]MCI2114285.1 O-antigen ligase family protein [Acidaminococcus sp.]MCI2117450.1 O-antigen ligase family protein [Acidaminococcus sp.]